MANLRSYAYVTLIVGFSFYLLAVGRDVFITFLIAVFLWLLIATLATWLEDRLGLLGRASRPVAYTLSIVIVVGILAVCATLLFLNVASFISAAPQIERRIDTIIREMLAGLELETPPGVSQLLRSFNFAATLRSFLFGANDFIGATIAVFIYTVFLLLEQRNSDHKISILFSKDEATARGRVRLITQAVRRYVGIKTFTSALTGIFTFIVLYVAGMDFAALLGVTTFLLNFIPIIGSIIAVVLAGVVSVLTMDSLGGILSIVAILTVVQFTIGSFVENRLLGSNLNLSPPFILLALSASGAVWGLPGMFLSVPMLVILMIILSGFERTRPIAVILSRTGDTTTFTQVPEARPLRKPRVRKPKAEPAAGPVPGAAPAAAVAAATRRRKGSLPAE